MFSGLTQFLPDIVKSGPIQELTLKIIESKPILEIIETFSAADWKGHHDLLRKHLDKFREAIKASQNREEAIKKIAKMDGLIALPVLMNIIEKIKKVNEARIEELFIKVTGKDMKMTIANDTMRGIIEKELKKNIKTEIETFAYNIKTADLTEEAVRVFMDTLINQFYSSAIRKYNDAAMGNFQPLLRTTLCLIFANILYFESDDRQTTILETGGELKIGIKMQSNFNKPHTIRNPFIIIQHAVKYITTDEITKPLWEEAAVWLEGLHARTFFQLPSDCRNDHDRATGHVKKLEDGSFPFVMGAAQKDDMAFNKNFGVTFYDIAFLHLEASKALQATLKLQEGKTVKVADVIQVKQRETLKLGQLSKIEKDANTVKIPKFVDYLRKYNLDANELEWLNTQYNLIYSGLKSYNTGRMWNRLHAGLFETAIKKVEATSSVVDRVIIVYDLWEELKGGGSDRGSNITTQLLNDSFTSVLRGAQETEDQKIQNTNRQNIK